MDPLPPPPYSEMTAGVSCQASEINALNFKLLYDDTSSDISINRKSLMRHEDAWETLRLRNSQFSSSFDHALLAAVAIANQSGATANQSAVDPIRTGLGDTMAAAAYPPNRATDVAAAGVATANEAVATALAQFVSLMNQGIAALQAVLVTAAGGASTPSQTQAKPAAPAA
jgi:hypothetical protein